jgi:hypothetical protein
MATSTTIPKPENIEHDEILKRVGRVQRERLHAMYQRAVSVPAAASLTEPAYYAQLLENVAIDYFNDQKIIGVDRREERAVLERKPAKALSVRSGLSPAQREAIRKLVITGKIPPTSPAAICAAQDEEDC